MPGLTVARGCGSHGLCQEQGPFTAGRPVGGGLQVARASLAGGEMCFWLELLGEAAGSVHSGNVWAALSRLWASLDLSGCCGSRRFPM